MQHLSSGPSAAAVEASLPPAVLIPSSVFDPPEFPASRSETGDAHAHWLAARHRLIYQDTPASARTSRTRVNLPLVEEEQDRPTTAISAMSAQVVARAISEDNVPTRPGSVRESEGSDKPTSHIVPAAEPAPSMPRIPQTAITFLTVSARRRNMNFDPDTTVGRVKELVWSGWPSEWADERPPTPSHLRLLHLGKILQDEETLSGLNIPSHIPDANTPSPGPTIVHLSVRPCALPTDDKDFKKQLRRGNGADMPDDARCCGSCIIC